MFKRTLTISAGNIIVTTLPPIPTIGLTKDDVEDLMNRTYQVMLTQFKLSSAEVQANDQLAMEQTATATTTSRNQLSDAADVSEKRIRVADEVRINGSSVQMSAQLPLAV